MNIFSLIKSLAKITATFVLVANSAFAAGGGDAYIKDFDFSFEGPLCLLYTSPSPRDVEESRMPSSA